MMMMNGGTSVTGSGWSEHHATMAGRGIGGFVLAVESGSPSCLVAVAICADIAMAYPSARSFISLLSPKGIRPGDSAGLYLHK